MKDRITNGPDAERRARVLADARSLASLWPRSETCHYDEVDESFHYHHPDGSLEISPGRLDETTYCLRFVDEGLCVEVKRLDDYKLHLAAQFVDAQMSDDDWMTLGNMLSRLVYSARCHEKLKDIALKPVWNSVFAALFPDDAWGQRPTRCPCLKTDPFALAAALRGLLKKARRLGAWEWKEWPTAGVASINKLAPLRLRKIRISPPSPEEEEAVRNSPDFGAAVLGWFDGKLLPFGMTLIAISPIDELQDFAVVPSATLNALGAALDVLCIQHERVTGPELSEGR